VFIRSPYRTRLASYSILVTQRRSSVVRLPPTFGSRVTAPTFWYPAWEVLAFLSKQVGEKRLSPCSHLVLSWLKFKTRAQCKKCRSICATYSFTCGDYGIVVCLLYKVYVKRQPVESHRPPLLWKVNGAIRDGYGQCFLLIMQGVWSCPFGGFAKHKALRLEGLRYQGNNL
jgi:hypothetical protein